MPLKEDIPSPYGMRMFCVFAKNRFGGESTFRTE